MCYFFKGLLNIQKPLTVVKEMVGFCHLKLPIMSCWFHVPVSFLEGLISVSGEKNGYYILLGCERECLIN